MSEVNHIVVQQQGVSIHKEVPAKRSSIEFDISQMSNRTKDAFKRVCLDGGASPADYCHIFESILGRKVVAEIMR
ncbi:hypothetical protein [Maridesulfovibrio zosterae]|uniref:hypothetical protein n=1 Tax=Maridesulfovibrio zosterae TaxID=82171 RepID=UPI0004263278|nr:hypothetical protein [Maridesulfovibrio zosterae]